MIAKSFKFTILFFIAFIAMQWLFRPEINWVDIISVSFVVFLFHLLFEWIEQRYKHKSKR